MYLNANTSFQPGIFPNNCKISKIIPLFKTGDKNDIKHYRPITLLPSFSKIFENLMLRRMLSFMRNNNILNESQHGFRSKHSILTALTRLLNHVTSALNNNKFILGLFLDVAKAFDSLNQKILLKKLEFYGFRGIIFDWFKNYLSKKFQYINQINGTVSMFKLTKSGIPQGSILGPTLFALYVNDMPFVNPEVSSVLNTDDTVLLISDNNLERLYINASNIFTEFSYGLQLINSLEMMLKHILLYFYLLDIIWHCIRYPPG